MAPQDLLLSQLSDLYSSLSPSPQLLIIDEFLTTTYAKELSPLLNNPNLPVFKVPAGESLKTLSSYHHYCELITSTINLHRWGSVLVMGGGSVLDFGGFLAATLLRGLPWISIPSTYLSMIDAAIGGKVALNTAAGKNLIGAFHSPQQVWVFKELLRTYKEDHLKNDLGELIKYALLCPPIAEKIIQGIDAKELIMDCASFKHHLTLKDPKESHPHQLRTQLNLGHTLAHALETLYSIPHGQAVYAGLLWEGLITQSTKESSQTRLTLKLGNILKLPPFLTPSSLEKVKPWSEEEILKVCFKDKKRSSSEKITLIRYQAPHKIVSLSLSYAEMLSELKLLEAKLTGLKG